MKVETETIRVNVLSSMFFSEDMYTWKELLRGNEDAILKNKHMDFSSSYYAEN